MPSIALRSMSIEPRATIGIVSGLYELFPSNDAVLESLGGLAEAIEPGGHLIYTNQPWHPQVEFIARVLRNREGRPWIMRRRTTAEMDQLVRASGFEKIGMDVDQWGMFTVSIARRGCDQYQTDPRRQSRLSLYKGEGRVRVRVRPNQSPHLNPLPLSNGRGGRNGADSIALMRVKALGVSAGLSILFLVVYGGCNWITSRRSDVGVFYFQWERSIPFVPFLVLPYMSIDLFFVAAPFFCRTDRELSIFAKRVVAAIFIAGICFLLFPLRFAFPRPHATGWTRRTLRLVSRNGRAV